MPTHKTDPFEWINNLSLVTSVDCDFCKYKENTAVDLLGRWVFGVWFNGAYSLWQFLIFVEVLLLSFPSCDKEKRTLCWIWYLLSSVWIFIRILIFLRTIFYLFILEKIWYETIRLSYLLVIYSKVYTSLRFFYLWCYIDNYLEVYPARIHLKYCVIVIHIRYQVLTKLCQLDSRRLIN